MHKDKRVAVVVPAFDEAEHLGRVLADMPDWVDDIVVVDDGSRDATASIAERHGGAVRVLRHGRNRGVGAAIVSGYRYAREAGADLVAVVAGDGQMDPGELVDLVAPVARGACDYCKGDRTTHPDLRQRMPWIRRVGNAVLTRWTRWVSGYEHLRDAQCGFTVMSGSMIDRLPLNRTTKRYGYPNDLLVMLAASGARVVEVPVTPIYGDERSDLKPWRAVWTHSAVIGRAWWWQRRQSRGL